MIKVNTKIMSSLIIAGIYFLAFLIVYFLFPVLTFPKNMVNVLIADVVATIVVFMFSILFSNSSVYDPYWSVAPPIIVIYLMNQFPDGNNLRQMIVLILVLFWSIAGIFTFSAILTEWVADEQLIKFRKNNTANGFMESGLWSVSRHPNYLGEISFWGGLFLFILSSSGFKNTGGYWTVAGFISMVILFEFISIPLMEKRNIDRNPGYREYIKKVPALLPRIFF